MLRSSRVSLRKSVLAAGILVVAGAGGVAAQDSNLGELIPHPPPVARQIVHPLPPEKRQGGLIDVTNDPLSRMLPRYGLRVNIELQFPSNSRREICEYLGQLLGCKVRLDEFELRELGFDLDERVQIVEKSVRLKDVLKDIFSDAVESVPLEDEILITSKKAARAVVETRFYDASLLDGTGLPLEDIRTMVAQATEPTRSAKGQVSIEQGLLVVHDNQATHDAVVEFLLAKYRALPQRNNR